MTSEQAWDWMDSIAHRLIRRAARNAPFSLSERLQEEWLADLAAQVGPIARLRFALGCCSATSVIAHERAVALPAASASLGHAHPIRAGHDHIPFFTGRTLTFVVVATVHVAVLYSLATALGPTYSKVSLSPLLNRPLEAPPRSAPPPLPPPRLSLPRIELPPQETPPPVQSEPANVIEGTLPEPPRVAQPPPSLPPAVNRVQGGPGVGFPSTDDFYPDASIRNGEKGVATVKACVDGKGRLTSEPMIIESSGSSRLDDGALRLAKAGSGHYRATAENGQPVNSCYPFRVRFELRN
jgi:TonB family protein